MERDDKLTKVKKEASTSIQRWDNEVSACSSKPKGKDGDLILVMEPQNPSPTKYFDNNGIPLRKAVEQGELMQDEDCPDDKSNEQEEKSTKKKTHIITINCCNCEKKFVSRSAYETHYRTNYQQEPIYGCPVCGKQIEQYRAYQLHSYWHINSARYRFPCQECSKTFHQKSDLARHQLTHVASPASVGGELLGEDGKGHIKVSVCSRCNESFETQSKLKVHMRKVHPVPKQLVECPDCGKYLSSGSIYSHRKIHSDNPKFACGECGRTFVQKINLIQHCKTHIGLRPYQCGQCDKSFCEKAHLQRHLNYHSDERPYRCDSCGKCYKTERCLKVHSAVHTTERPFVCSECNKGFLSSSKLRQHSNIHSGLRPYKCKYCTRDFTNFPNWLKHIRRRHKVDHRTGEKLDSVPKFMTKKKDAPAERGNESTKVSTAKPRKRASKAISSSAPEILKEESLPYVSESSNIDLNLVCKDDLIQPLAGEIEDIFKCLPSDESKLSIIDPLGVQLVNDSDVALFPNDLLLSELECDVSDKNLITAHKQQAKSTDLCKSENPSSTMLRSFTSETLAGPLLYDAQLPIFSTMISICGGEQHFQLINPHCIHPGRSTDITKFSNESLASVPVSVSERKELLKQ
ncbi:zinc finger protein 3 homolog [Anopheles cruzii]|uniref:zinc finger protein 3 homolog n=1 Tax=Anopheles cruzii TaxID=68878 RepID=UPI0022EC8D63|nr:zinc finger protein 3 homolog [Anopheles cruzii]